MNVRSVGIVGGGAWGTALAQTMAEAGHDVILWAYEAETVREINEFHINRTYLAGVDLNHRLRATGQLSDVVACDVILLVPPAQHLRKIAEEMAPMWHDGKPVVVCAKGIEISTGRLMGNVVSEALPNATLAILSGPSFAADVARGLPAALTLACANETSGRLLAEALGYRQFRIYWSQDLAGVQFGGAFKNVMAIAAGIVEGKALGASAHAALVARGFHEMRRLGQAFGAETDTLMGLSGLGDLILTCGSAQSRNMSLGRALGQGRTLEEVIGSRSSVTEGVYTAEAVHKISQERNIEMPIAEAVYAIVSGAQDVDTAISELLSRPMKSEKH
ncbi:MAG: NAD(P)H-dependent glycerol-3-phosphate dehydrogenase [Hyphomicrobiaceae bacterium]